MTKALSSPGDPAIRCSLVLFAHVAEAVTHAALTPRHEPARRLISAARRLPRCECILSCTPGSSIDAVAEWIGADVPCEPQTEGALGARIASAMYRRFDAGAQYVVVMDAYREGVQPMMVDLAFAALDFSDVVYGPAANGGIYTIGMKRIYPDLLLDIPWGTIGALDRALQRARARRVAVTLLPELPAGQPGTGWRSERSGDVFVVPDAASSFMQGRITR